MKNILFLIILILFSAVGALGAPIEGPTAFLSATFQAWKETDTIRTPSHNKFLVNLFEGLSMKHLFVLLWITIIGFFVLLMVLGYRRTIRRNFRSGEVGPRVAVAKRRLSAESKPTLKG